MRIFVTACAVALAAACFLPAALPAHNHTHCSGDGDLFRGDEVSIEMEDSSIVFTNDDNDETIEITEKGDLLVNDEPVQLNRDERKLVEEYYETYMNIVEEAKELGLQGAKVGARGAALGLKAALGALLLISPDYDKSDLEESLDEEEEKLDRIAKKLEKRAKRIEKHADSLERIHKKLRRDVKELDDLGWF